MEKSKYYSTLVATENTENNDYSVSVFKKVIDREYLQEWVHNNEVKLLTLDGTFGGVCGKEYYWLTTDADAKDDWHIGKKYDMQGWFRYPIVISYNDNGNVFISQTDDKDGANAYLVVSKKDIREKSKNLKRAKTQVLEEISDKMVDKYLGNFNNISNGEVYAVSFFKGFVTYNIDDIIDCINEDTYKMVLANLPMGDKEFDVLLNGCFTQLSNVDTYKSEFLEDDTKR